MRRTPFLCLVPALLLAACGDDATGDDGAPDVQVDTGDAADAPDSTEDIGSDDSSGDDAAPDAGNDAMPGDTEDDDTDSTDVADAGDADTGVIPDSGDTSDADDTSADADDDTDAGPPPTVFIFVPDEGPTEVDPDFVTADGLILNRLDVTLEAGATAEDLADALASLGGTIAASRPGLGWLTVTIAPAADLAEIEEIAADFSEEPGILIARPSWIADVDDAPSATPLGLAGPGTAANNELARQGFFAAWNAQSLATNAVPVYVADSFTKNEVLPQLAHMRFVGPPAPRIQVADDSGDFAGNHGFWVASALGALADDVPPVGTHPDPATSMDLIAVQTLSQGSVIDVLLLLDRELPTRSFFILNTSFGVKEDVSQSAVLDMALLWRSIVARRSPQFLQFASTGNEGYIREFAQWLSPFAIQSRTDDPRIFMEDGIQIGLANLYWDNAVATYGDGVAVRQGVTLMVGATLRNGDFGDFNRGGDITMIGEQIVGVCDRIGGFCNSERLFIADGTSAATPVAAGLGAWLASIDPSMSAEDLAAWLRRFFDDEDGYVDARRATWALTERGIPVARAIADVVTDGNIDDNDILGVLGDLEQSMTDFADFTLVEKTWPRTDLNGDGFVRSDSYTQFDLDDDGAIAEVVIEVSDGDGGSREKRISESSVSDLEFLCWMGYGPWFSGDTTVRDDLLGAYCGRPDSYLAELVGRTIEISTSAAERVRTVPGAELIVTPLYSDADSDGFSGTDFFPDVPVSFGADVAGNSAFSVPGDSGSLSGFASADGDNFRFDGEGNVTGGSFSGTTDCSASYASDGFDGCNFVDSEACADAVTSSSYEYMASFILTRPHRLTISGRLTSAGLGGDFDLARSGGTFYVSLNDTRTTWTQSGGAGLDPETLDIVYDEEIPTGFHTLYASIYSFCSNAEPLAPNPQAWEGQVSISFTLSPLPAP